MLARSSADDLVVVTVVPAPWVPGMAKVEAEYQAFLDEEADTALDFARRAMPEGVKASYVSHSARSAPGGLLEVADEHSARLVAVGSSSAGVSGHVALGSVSDGTVALSVQMIA